MLHCAGTQAGTDDSRQYLAGLLHTLTYMGVLLSNHNLRVLEVRWACLTLIHAPAWAMRGLPDLFSMWTMHSATFCRR